MQGNQYLAGQDVLNGVGVRVRLRIDIGDDGLGAYESW